MALFEKRDDDRPGERRRKDGGGSVFTKEMGPLPVWGWAIVALGGVFLYRAMVKPPGSKEGEEEGDLARQMYPYPTGGVGGVFLVPSGAAGGGVTPTPPATETPPASNATEIFNWAQKMIQGTQAKQYELESARGVQHAHPPEGMSFLASTAAAAAQGLPHVRNESGSISVFNPRTGQRVPLATWQGFNDTQRMLLTTGNPQAWASV